MTEREPIERANQWLEGSLRQASRYAKKGLDSGGRVGAVLALVAATTCGTCPPAVGEEPMYTIPATYCETPKPVPVYEQ